MTEPQFVDPGVSRRKFDREIAEFRSQAADYGRLGWFLVDAEFPSALAVLAIAKTQPMSILTGVLFDYANYDAVPPSVRLVHPLTREPYRLSELPTRLIRNIAEPAAESAPGPLPKGVEQVFPPEFAQALAQGAVKFEAVVPQPLMQALGDEDLPFLCVAGVREYHENPAHSGDDWELHRTSGAGRLVRILQIISKYGLEPISGFEVQFAPQIKFRVDVPPN